MKRWRAVLLIPVVILIAGCENPAPPAQGDGEVKIGFIGPVKGADQAQGQDTLEGAQAAQAVLPRLDNGDTVSIIVEEGNGDPEVIRQAMRKLVQVDGVTALLLGLDSELMLQIAPFVETLGIPAIALIATHPGIVRDSSYISQLCFDDETQGLVAALFVRDELLIKRAAVFFDDGDPHSRALAQAFEAKFSASSGNLTVSSTINDITPETLGRLQAADTELLYLPIHAKHLLQAKAMLEEMDWSPEIMAGDGLLASVLGRYPEQADKLEGIYATDLFSDSGDFVRHRRLGKKAAAAFENRFDSEATTFTDLGVEGYAIVLNAMNQCATPGDRACVNEKIRSTVNFEGIMARITIDSNGRASRPVYVNTIENGALDSVVKVY